MNFLLCLAVSGDHPLDFEQVSRKSAPAYPCDVVDRFENGRVTALFYKYDYEISELRDSNVHFSGTSARFSFGFSTRTNDRIIAPTGLIGDYLHLELDCETLTGSAVRPSMSFVPLFMYEDRGWLFLASEISLIAQIAPSLRGRRLGTIFNYDFIYDSIFNEWAEREFPRDTAVDGITRVFPHERLSFDRGRARIDDGTLFEVTPEQSSLYEKDRDEFYRQTFADIVSFGEQTLQRMQRKEILLDLSGGLDSRCTLALLREVGRRTGIRVKTKTYGPEDHPDVVVANQIAKVLGDDHEYCRPAPTKPGSSPFLPRSESDYWNCFILSQGDWNSNNYRTSRTSVRTAHFTGQDNYKRITFKQAVGLNRWYSRRMSYTQIVPILANDGANLCASIFSRTRNPNSVCEFVYYCLLYFEPKLLDVPFAGVSLPMRRVEPYKTVRETKIMPHMVEPAFYDQSIVAERLGGLFGRRMDISTIDDERKRRMAMDFACASQHVLGEWV